MNTLEDAYINIAREEQRLLEDLEKNGIRRMSRQSSFLKSKIRGEYSSSITDNISPKSSMTGHYSYKPIESS